MKAKLKIFFKDLWEGIKVGDVRSLFFAAVISILPVFLYSILGSIFFGLTISGFYDLPIIMIILMVPFLIIMGYLAGMSLYVMIWKWILRPLIKKNKGD